MKITDIPAPRDGSSWTVTEDIIVQRTDITLVEMCFMLGRSYQAVTNRRRALRKKIALPQRDWREEIDNAAEQRLVQLVFTLTGQGLPLSAACEHTLRKYTGHFNESLYERLFIACRQHGNWTARQNERYATEARLEKMCDQLGQLEPLSGCLHQIHLELRQIAAKHRISRKDRIEIHRLSQKAEALLISPQHNKIWSFRNHNKIGV